MSGVLRCGGSAVPPPPSPISSRRPSARACPRNEDDRAGDVRVRALSSAIGPSAWRGPVHRGEMRLGARPICRGAAAWPSQRRGRPGEAPGSLEAPLAAPPPSQDGAGGAPPGREVVRARATALVTGSGSTRVSSRASRRTARPGAPA